MIFTKRGCEYVGGGEIFSGCQIDRAKSMKSLVKDEYRSVKDICDALHYPCLSTNIYIKQYFLTGLGF